MRKSKETRRVPLVLGSLSGHVEIFRIARGARSDPAVARWFSEDPIGLRALAHEWFTRMRQCGSEVREQLHDGCPVAMIEDAPFGYVNAFKNHVNVGFFYGAMLEDPAGLLEGSGKRMRHVKLTPSGAVDSTALDALIVAAYADIRRRLGDCENG